MLDTVIHTARSFAEFYGISRERLARIIAVSLRERSGVFALEGFGFFRAEQTAPKRMEIRPYYPTREEQESILPYAISGSFRPVQPDSAQRSASQAAQRPASASDEPTAYALDLQLKLEKIEQLRQKNILEQARLREETVSYCASAVQYLLTGLRSELNDLNLPPDISAAIRTAVSNTLDDLAAILPDIVSGVPSDRIELAISSRRAARLSAARSQVTPQPSQGALS